MLKRDQTQKYLKKAYWNACFLVFGFMVSFSFSANNVYAELVTDLTETNVQAVAGAVPSGSVFARVTVTATSLNKVTFNVDANPDGPPNLMPEGTNFGDR